MAKRIPESAKLRAMELARSTNMTNLEIAKKINAERHLRVISESTVRQCRVDAGIQQSMRTPEGRPTKYDYEQIRKLYRGGLGYREISERIGCSHTTIFTALTKDDPIVQKTCIPGPDEINRPPHIDYRAQLEGFFERARLKHKPEMSKAQFKAWRKTDEGQATWVKWAHETEVAVIRRSA